MNTVGILMFVGVISFSTDPDRKRLDQFLKKLDHFFERVGPTSDRWPMPNFETGRNDTQMPGPELEMKFRDEETGLEYSPQKGKIYSADLKIGLDVNTGIVYDFKSGKKYKLDELKLKLKRAKG